jgi:hypothetical protein
MAASSECCNRLSLPHSWNTLLSFERSGSSGLRAPSTEDGMWARRRPPTRQRRPDHQATSLNGHGRREPAQDRQVFSSWAMRYPAGSCSTPGTIGPPRMRAERSNCVLGPNLQSHADRTGDAPAWYFGLGRDAAIACARLTASIPCGGTKPVDSAFCRRPAQSEAVPSADIPASQPARADSTRL